MVADEQSALLSESKSFEKDIEQRESNLTASTNDSDSDSEVEGINHLYSYSDDEDPSPRSKHKKHWHYDGAGRHSFLDNISWYSLPDLQHLIKLFKYANSIVLLVFCVGMVTAAMYANKTPMARATSPLMTFVLMWALILWLGVLEGAQGSLVGLKPIDSSKYAHSHPISLRCTNLAHEGDNLNRFIVGRQFLVVLVIFVVNLCCTVVVDPPPPPGEGLTPPPILPGPSEDGPPPPILPFLVDPPPPPGPEDGLPPPPPPGPEEGLPPPPGAEDGLSPPPMLPGGPEDGPPPPPPILPFFSNAMVEAFLISGLAVMLITVILGQLSAEVNATECMLDFINSHTVFITTWVCLAIEASGILHSVYLVRSFFALFSDNDDKDNTASHGQDHSNANFRTSLLEQSFYWGRVLVSFACVSYAMAVTISALLHDETTMYEGLGSWVNVAIFFGLIVFLGILEAMQIALFAVVNLPPKELEGYPVAQANCRLAFRGNNFQAFLIGRQIFVTMCMFLLARITTTNVEPTVGPGGTVLGMSHGVQDFFNTGLPGALITTIVASVAWRSIAATFPVAFMANPLVYLTIRLCLLVESTGVFSSAWLFAAGLKKVVGFRNDEDYIGSLGQREGGHHPPKSDIDDTEVTMPMRMEYEQDEEQPQGYGATA